MAEEIVFADDTVSISTARVVISGVTYALRNITSVKMSSTVTPAKPPKRGCATTLLILGIVELLGWLSMFSESPKDEVHVHILHVILIPAIFVAAILITGGVVWLRSAKGTEATTDYHVTISSSSGEAHALTSKEKSYIEKVVASINDAIVSAI